MMNSTWWRITTPMVEPLLGSISSRLSVFRAQIDNISKGPNRKATRMVRLITGEVVWKSPVLWAGETDVKLNITRDLLKFLHHINHIRHTNVNRFVGITVDTVPLCVVESHCKRGSLDDILDDSKIDMDMAFSFLQDLVQGMTYINDSFLKYHGNLTSSKCLLDTQFGLKIGDIANDRLLNLLTLSKPVPLTNKSLMQKGYERFFWTAPEVLRGDPQTEKGDVYSFAIITYQILTGRMLAYDDLEYSFQDIIEFVQGGRDVPFRPIMDFEQTHFCYSLPGIQELVNMCWAENPSDRLTWAKIAVRLKKGMLESGMEEGRSLFDRVMARLSGYAANLEEIVEQRTQQLMEEREKCDTILGEMLPRPVIALLRSGQAVMPEHFDVTTIFFSDLVGFVDFVDRTPPLLVMEFLHLVYSRFDEVLSMYEVYKVETIGDSYMVASGLPERNGNAHIKEICRLALALQILFPKLYTARGLQDPDKKLGLRVGINTGPVVAGVVGHKTPRYCLFGDTINTASRMESNGLPSHIHLSQSAATLAEECGFLVKERGEMEIKGKGRVMTYWLEREVGPQRQYDYLPMDGQEGATS